MKYSEMSIEDVQTGLAAVTPVDMIEWKPTNLREENDGGYSALGLAYCDARFVQNRLDEVLGGLNWQTKAEVVSNLLLVGIGIRHPETNEWVWKWDTGQGGEDDSGGYGGGKGLFSQGFKRAAYQWGIARDLYALPTPRCRCKAYLRNKKPAFVGWIENPWSKAESSETGRLHRSQVERTDPAKFVEDEGEEGRKVEEGGKAEPSVDFIPATSTTFYTLAFVKLKIEREQARETLQPFINKQTGDIDYEKGILLLEKNLPAEDRAFTNQKAEMAKKVLTEDAESKEA